MFISYEELKVMEEKYAEELRNATAHLEVIRELIKVAESKTPPVLEEQNETNTYEEDLVEEVNE